MIFQIYFSLQSSYIPICQVTQLKASEQMHVVASEKQQKEENLKEALEEQLAQVNIFYI